MRGHQRTAIQATAVQASEPSSAARFTRLESSTQDRSGWKFIDQSSFLWSPAEWELETKMRVLTPKSIIFWTACGLTLSDYPFSITGEAQTSRSGERNQMKNRLVRFRLSFLLPWAQVPGGWRLFRTRAPNLSW